MEIKCAVQNYAWGIPGSKSLVAQLAKSCDSSVIEETKPYAELWMGSHPNGPSIVKECNTTLKSIIDENPDILGGNIINKFGKELSFLFKVLSVNQALSIQAHPNKSHAEKLHEERPTVYKDPNHKPEMCLALTRFEALCGFRPSSEIIHFLNTIPALSILVGDSLAKSFMESPNENTLKDIFSSLMHAKLDTVSAAFESAKSSILPDDENQLGALFETLHKQYPADRGCFAIYFINYIVLQPGEAMFLGPNIIHAYLSGDCMECMACSDNVVRAGLTPKFQDVETLVEMLEYQMLPSESNKFKGIVMSSCITVFNPPVPDFAVERIKVEKHHSVSLPVHDSASILIVIEGKVKEVTVTPSNSIAVESPNKISKGCILFLECNQDISFVAEEDTLCFRAFCA